MEYSYVAYNKDRSLIKGKVTADNESAARKLIDFSGYQLISMKANSSLINWKLLNTNLSQIKPKEIIMFSRQLALLLESGTDIITSLELLQEQVGDKTLRNVLGEIVTDIRGGSSLSAAMSKHPKIFENIYYKAIAVGEKGGNLETVLRHMADFLEKQALTRKKIKSALSYPVIVSVVAFLVVGVIVVFVLPTFINLYSSLSVEVPAILTFLLNFIDWLKANFLIILLVVLAIAGGFFAYTRTEKGRYRLDRLKLRLPVIGRILHLTELAQSARTISMLFRVGLPLPEVMNLAIGSTDNKFVAEAFEKVQRDLIRGEGISKPMRKNKFFLPLMVQMVAVGEGTGHLDSTLVTVAESYEMEADDRTTAAVGLIQPILTVFIGLIVGFVAILMLSTMYSMYGQL
ncbi:MAG: type II secretion system F family protein [Dehalococcoidales bacterium]|nr:type II secretion system F family protein [Dehalococcoidales bacterium]